MRKQVRKPLLPYSIDKIGAREKKVLQDQKRNFSTYTSPLLFFFTIILMVGFVLFDGYTIYSIIQLNYNDDALASASTALMIASLIDAGPFFLAKIEGSVVSPSDKAEQKARKRSIIGFLLAALLGFSLFLCMTLFSMFDLSTTAPAGGFSSLTGNAASAAQPNSPNYALLLRAIFPVATSFFSYLLGVVQSPKKKRIHELLQKRAEEQARYEYNQNLAEKFKKDLEQFDCDRFDLEESKIALRELCNSAKKTLWTTKAALADELGSFEAANALLSDFGTGDDWYSELEKALNTDFTSRNSNVPLIALLPEQGSTDKVANA